MTVFFFFLFAFVIAPIIVILCAAANDSVRRALTARYGTERLRPMSLLRFLAAPAIIAGSLSIFPILFVVTAPENSEFYEYYDERIGWTFVLSEALGFVAASFALVFVVVCILQTATVVLYAVVTVLSDRAKEPSKHVRER